MDFPQKVKGGSELFPFSGGSPPGVGSREADKAVPRLKRISLKEIFFGQNGWKRES
ncbi:MAG: hypothetical protein V8Q84_04655 [Bilophila sp.]